MGYAYDQKQNNNLHNGSFHRIHGLKNTSKLDYEGHVHHEYATRGQTINKEYYVQVLKRFRHAVRRKRLRFDQAVIGLFSR